MWTVFNKTKRRLTAAEAAKAISQKDAKIILDGLSRFPADQIDMNLVDLCADIINGDDPQLTAREERRALSRFWAALEERKKSGGGIPRLRLRKRMVVAVAIIATLLLMTAVAAASGLLPWRFWWESDADSHYIYLEVDDNAQTFEDPDVFTPTGLSPEVDAFLEQNGIYVPLPSWIPEGFELEEMTLVGEPDEISTIVYVSFVKDGDKYLTFSIYKYFAVDTAATHGRQKDDKVFERVDIGGMEYTIYSNLDLINAAWVNIPYVCGIFADVTVEEMRQIVASIPTRE